MKSLATIIEISFGILTTISIFDIFFFLWYADILLPNLLLPH